MDNLDERLLALAAERERVDALELKLKTEIAVLQAELKVAQGGLSAMESSLKNDLLDYCQSTGDLHVHPSVHFHRTKTLMYDRDEVLKQVQANDEGDLIRVKTELNVKAFEEAWREGRLPYAQVEEVNAPTIAIDKLGHLLLGYGGES